MNHPTRRPCPPRHRGGFTLIELLVVIVVLALLVALLLPAIGGAIAQARNAAVSAEINQLAQAMADFRSRYGDYPPSRIVLNENGKFDTTLTTYTWAALSPSSVDISDGQLNQRSLSYLRKFFPRLQLSSSAALYSTTTGFPDFNGNGILDGPKLITGDECLVFFLGGIPTKTVSGGQTTFGMTGFSKNPINPFQTQALSPANRVNPLFEFRSDRLVDVEGDGFPSYFDSLKTNRPYAYFSSYGGTGYDPNDVNYDKAASPPNPLGESDDAGTTPQITLTFNVNFPVSGGTATANVATSPSPNPYSSSFTNITPVTYLNPQSFQIISAGADGLYGVGGIYTPSSEQALPPEPNSTPTGANDATIRSREKDNLTNFTTSKLD